jgi:hypothetical protein
LTPMLPLALPIVLGKFKFFDHGCHITLTQISAPNKIAAPKARADGRLKVTPKPVTSTARGRGAARGNKAAGARGGAGRSGNGRSKSKTAEQLDQEMVDYFGGNETAAAAAPVAAANGGNIGMDDDTVLVGTP